MPNPAPSQELLEFLSKKIVLIMYILSKLLLCWSPSWKKISYWFIRALKILLNILPNSSTIENIIWR